MNTTYLVLGITVAVLIIYDIYICYTHGGDATISWVTYSLAQRHPIIAFALGVVMGHILWVQACQCLS
jgi:hypothetical protein